LTVLGRLDRDRKRSVLQFLYESSLIAANRPIVAMNGADLSKLDLSLAHLRGSDLSFANLSGADLRIADLQRTYLRRADLRDANLNGAILNNANLTGAFLTYEQLTSALSLDGATMPNGQKYEDWLKDKEGRKENE
jgi:uncharacterized protein YjbI with pentapeptide repeats